MKQLLYSLSIGISFLIVHIAMAHFKLSDVANLILSLAMMILAQLLAFIALKRFRKQEGISFRTILSMLCSTQAFLILLLALNSAFNPMVEIKPLNVAEISISLLIFAGAFPLIITSIIWFAIERKHEK